MSRLSSICNLISKTSCIADIGCDHGIVSEYIYTNKLADTLIVNDISSPSLKKAEHKLEQVISKDNTTSIKYICAGGQDLVDNDISLGIIAGMGGRVIIDIVASLKLDSFILSPQNHARELRTYLVSNGYSINRDFTVEDNDKFYDIMLVAKGRSKPLTDMQLYYGLEYNIKSNDLLNRLNRDLSAYKTFKQTDENIKVMQIIQGVIECLK